MTPTPSNVREVLDGIRHIVHELRVSSRAAETEAKVSGAQLFVLQRMAPAEGLSISDLAAQTFTHLSSVSVVVARLTALGLARRARSKEDGRRAVVTITERGRRVLACAPGMAQERLIAAIEALPARDRKQLAGSLTRIAVALGMRNEPPLFFEASRASATKRRAR